MADITTQHTASSIRELLTAATSVDDLHEIANLFDDETVVITCNECGYTSIKTLLYERSKSLGLNYDFTEAYLELLCRHVEHPEVQAM